MKVESLDNISVQQKLLKQRQNFTANMSLRMSMTQRNTRPISRVNFPDDANSVSDDLSNFESKMAKGHTSQKKNYPNIELKRCFDARNFKESNQQITRLASTRAGTLRSHVQTTVPRKRLVNIYKDSFEAGDEVEVSDLQY